MWLTEKTVISVGAIKKGKKCKEHCPKVPSKVTFNENNPEKEREEGWDWRISAAQLCPLFSDWKGLNHLLIISNEDHAEHEARLFSQVPSERVRGNRSKLHQCNSNGY